MSKGVDFVLARKINTFANANTEPIGDVNGSTAVFIYDGKNILAELDKDGTRTNIYGSSMIATTGTDEVYYQYNNHGDVIRVSDRTGTLLNEYDYDAFGNAITESEKVRNPYRYAGYYQDAESGLYYLRSRYYNPKTARFLTEDTALGKYTDPLSLNKYTYCHNQPVTQDDPTGHWAHIVAGALIGGLIGGGISYASQAIKNKSFTKGIDWKKVAGGAAEGAITGAIGAATGGASFAAKSVAEVGIKTAAKQFVKKAAVDVGANFVGNTANQLISKGSKNYSLKEAIVAGASGIASTVGEYGVQAAKKAGSMAVTKVAEKIGSKAGNKAAAEAGSHVASKTLMSSETAGMASAGAEAVSNSPLASLAKTGAGEADDSAAKVLMKEGGAGDLAACFSAGTKIKTVDGDKDIEDIKVGDKVYAHNCETEETGVKAVSNLFVHETKDIAHVTVGCETIDATITHPFYVVGYGFQSAGELHAGDSVLLLDGSIIKIDKVEIEHLKKPIKVYNFEVEDWHTYYVAEQGVLVHNICSTKTLDGGSDSVLKPNTKPDFIVTSEGVALPTNKDYNLVSTSLPTNKGGEYFQIHNTHIDKKVNINPHTHQPQINVDPVSGRSSSKRLIRITTADDINYADKMMRNRKLRERINIKDVGGF